MSVGTLGGVIERFWFWVYVTAAFGAGIMFIKPMILELFYPELVLSVRPGLIWYCRVLVVLLGSLWFVEMAVLLGMAGCWLLAMSQRGAYRPALHVAILIPALAVGIWGQAMPMAWLSAKEVVDRVGGLHDFAGIFDEAVPLLGVQFMMLIVLVIATIAVLVKYFKWRSKATVTSYLNGSRQPRLIVNGGLQVVLAVCTIVGTSLVFLLGLFHVVDYSYRDHWAGQMFVEVNMYAVGVLFPLGGLSFFILPRLRAGFDIVLDVVNHFYFRSTVVKDALDDEDEFDIRETTFESGSLFFSRREAIHGRLKRILTHYRDRLEKQTNLVLVSHSQGTMVAIEVLNDPELSWLRNRFDNITLITMGCPLSNLYQHYFRHHYPPLHEPYWSELRMRVDQWTNIYRIDDYVGREIEFPDVEPEPCAERGGDLKTVYSNHAVGPRGHLGYWMDREVLDVLRHSLSEAPIRRRTRVAA